MASTAELTVVEDGKFEIKGPTHLALEEGYLLQKVLIPIRDFYSAFDHLDSD